MLETSQPINMDLRPDFNYLGLLTKLSPVSRDDQGILKKRKRGTEKSEILTSTPYKQHLEDRQRKPTLEKILNIKRKL